MKEKHTFNIFIFLLLLTLINHSSSQILIQSGGMEGPTIISRQTFTVRSNDGTPVTITKINIHSGRNINSREDKLTPFDLMRIMDSRMNDFFEAIIARQIGIFNAIEQAEAEAKEKEKEKEKEIDNNNNNNQKNSNENNNNIDDKEFELDEEKEGNKNVINTSNSNNTNDNNIKEEENNKKEGNKNKKMKKIGKITVNEDNIKKFNQNQNIKKRGKKLTKKEIIFSRVCKYIFYSIILFTFYILIKKLLEILEIIDPENSQKNGDVNINNNNNNEEKKEKIENEIIVNKERENKQN